MADGKGHTQAAFGAIGVINCDATATAC